MQREAVCLSLLLCPDADVYAVLRAFKEGQQQNGEKEMIHKFSMHGANIVLDVNSGAYMWSMTLHMRYWTNLKTR